jgi:catechol 2,3-dioxygenase-like lactoylglutathione lyase family enzyme
MATTRLTGIQHVGIPVASMERSLRFYKDVFGIEPDFVAGGSGEELSQAVGVREAELSFAFLRIGDSILELLEYSSPQGRPYDRSNCDVGAVHIAFEVPDIDAAYEELSAKDVEFNAPPLKIGEGPLAGCAFAYFNDPDGVQLEIFQVAR